MAAPSYLRQVAPPQAETAGSPIDVDLPDEVNVDPKSELIRIEYSDGSVAINLGGLVGAPRGESSEHTANLAEHIDEFELRGIGDELLRLIEEDENRQQQKMADITKGIDLLGVKLEEPRSEPGEEGMSVVRHPVLLEAVLRFQANARGELLPTDGPVKVRDDGPGSIQIDDEANKLARDFNHYLTVGAPEYYPDTDRMLFKLGFGGEAYRKVYYCPIKRRPVCQTVDRKDLILADGAVSLEACTRITHRTEMSPSFVRRMMLLGAWRNVSLTSAPITQQGSVDEKLANVSGVAPRNFLDQDNADRTIYECYCELDLPGFEHEEDGEPTGLQLPYRVTIEKETREVLEIRRWWRENDETYLRKEVFVDYVFVPAFDGVNLGLLHILGNATRALTGAWRIALDNGMLANFPGGLQARSSGRQNTSNIRVSPGQVAQIDTDGQPINSVFMPLPYRDVTPGFLGVVNEITQTSERLGSIGEVQTGEGRQDAPVGTTIALIEQAQKILSAVHKRMHAAQQREFAILKDLFKEDPESLWRKNGNPNLPQDAQTVISALENSDLVPAADPNTSSQTLRIQKAIAVKQAAMANPLLYDIAAVERRFLTMIGVGDVDELLAKAPPPAPQQDPTGQMLAQAELMKAQAKMQETQIKASTAERDTHIKLAETQLKAKDVEVKAMKAATDSQNRAKDRTSQMAVEQMRLDRERLIHNDKLSHDQQVHQDSHGLETARFLHDVSNSQEQNALARDQAAQQPPPGLKGE